MKPIYEFLLWNNCSNNCTFCHQRAYESKNSSKILSPEEQIDSINKCIKFLDTTFIKGNHILLCGGEIFDIINEDVKNSLRKLLNKIFLMMNTEEIELLYLNTNLLYKDTELLIWCLDRIQEEGLFNRLHFTTSYDIQGRFTSAEREILFYKNLKYVTDNYKDINVIVNTVLTEEACKRILNNKFGANYLLEYLEKQNKDSFSIKDWIVYFKVDINTIPYIILDSNNAPGAPTKSLIFNTLMHIDNIIPGYLKKYANNIALKQEKKLYEYNKIDKDLVYCSSSLSEKCGHSINFKRSFKDSDSCYPCEIMKLSTLKD